MQVILISWKDAIKQCDYLIVAVCGDDYVTQVKKKHWFLLKKNA